MDDSTRQQLHIDHNEARHRFEAGVGDSLAVADYEMDGDLMIFTHTEVPEAFRGEGIAGRLVRTGLEHAREKGLAVRAECPYVKSYLDNHREYRDLRRA